MGVQSASATCGLAVCSAEHERMRQSSCHPLVSCTGTDVCAVQHMCRFSNRLKSVSACQLSNSCCFQTIVLARQGVKRRLPEVLSNWSVEPASFVSLTARIWTNAVAVRRCVRARGGQFERVRARCRKGRSVCLRRSIQRQCQQQHSNSNSQAAVIGHHYWTGLQTKSGYPQGHSCCSL